MTSTTTSSGKNATVLTKERKMNLILIPIDGSKHCKRAFEWYSQQMKSDYDFIVFVSVVEPVYTSSGFGMAVEAPVTNIGNIVDESLRNGRKLCNEYLQHAKSAKIESQAFLYVDNRPGSAIIKAVDEHNACMVLMGNRGNGTARRTFLGSVSDYVLHHSHVPVVIVPPVPSEHK